MRHASHPLHLSALLLLQLVRRPLFQAAAAAGVGAGGRRGWWCGRPGEPTPGPPPLPLPAAGAPVGIISIVIIIIISHIDMKKT